MTLQWGGAAASSQFYLYIMEIKSTTKRDVLLEKIQKHNEEYRRGAPTISDSEYDILVEELKNIDPIMIGLNI